MKNIFNVFCYILSLFAIIACSDDNVNDFSPVPYPDEVVDPNPDPDPDPDSKPIWEITSPTITVMTFHIVFLPSRLQRKAAYSFFVKLAMELGKIKLGGRIF